MFKRRSSKQGLLVGTMIPKIEEFKLTKLTASKHYAFIFISLHCMRCIEFIPFLSDLKVKYDNIEIFLMSTGENKENEELMKYYSWEFQIFHMNEENMLLFFNVDTPPFVIIVNSQGLVMAKGEVFNNKDFENIMNQAN
ncbi:hypothetical protein D3C76_548220 [compost metagenome]